MLLASTRLVVLRLDPNGVATPTIAMLSPGSSVARPQATWLPGSNDVNSVPVMTTAPAIKVPLLPRGLNVAPTMATEHRADMLLQAPHRVLPLGNNQLLPVDNPATDMDTPTRLVWLRRLLLVCLPCTMVVALLPALPRRLLRAMDLLLRPRATSRRLLPHRRKQRQRCRSAHNGEWVYWDRFLFSFSLFSSAISDHGKCSI